MNAKQTTFRILDEYRDAGERDYQAVSERSLRPSAYDGSPGNLENIPAAV
jgi:hypothetical protein